MGWHLETSDYGLGVKIIAHRGASQEAPENTLEAFRLAWAQGADGIELDVQRSRDGQVVVFHDEDGRRVAGVDRRIVECDGDEIRRWDVGSWKGGVPARVPLLSDVLAEAPAGRVVLVEIKDGPAILPAVRDRLRAYPGRGTAVLTFDSELAARAVQELTGVPVHLNLESDDVRVLEAAIAKAASDGLAGVSFGWRSPLTPSIIRKTHDAGLVASVWTVNDPDDARRAADWGVDVLMTDGPRALREALGHG